MRKTNNDNLISQADILITVASWEERFILGFERLLASVKPNRVLMFYYKEYKSWSEENLMRSAQYCENERVQLFEEELSFTSLPESWKRLVKLLLREVTAGVNVTVDITTMPREVIWTICGHLAIKCSEIQYVYHLPEGYGDWLSRDPGRPRIVYKMGGICTLGNSTTLVVLTGYDVERTKQLIRFYEPEDIFLGLQVGEQFESAKRNRTEHKEKLTRNKNIRWFDINGHSVKESLASLEKYVSPFLNEKNIILSSLGPKVGALALYRFHQLHPKTAISYAPSNEFNKEYSHGIQKTIAGTLNFSTGSIQTRSI